MRKSGGSTVSAMKQQHWQGGGLADILVGSDAGILNGVEFSPWDSELSVSQQPHYDVIIHKLTEDIERASAGESSPRINALQFYLKQHPTTVLVDPICSVQNVTSRMKTCSCLSSIERKYLNGIQLSSLDIDDMKAGSHHIQIHLRDEMCPINQPKHFVVESESQDVSALMLAHGMAFPIICKPLVACGTPLSHFMVVVVKAKDINMIQRPCVVQQYYDHDAVLYKVYVIGDDVMVYKRPSLPNLCSVFSRPDQMKNTISSSRIGDSSSSSSNGDSNSRCKATCIDSLVRPPVAPGGGGGSSSSSSRVSPLIRSVAFDSRYAYPSLSDFLGPLGGPVMRPHLVSSGSEQSEVAASTSQKQTLLQSSSSASSSSSSSSSGSPSSQPPPAPVGFPTILTGQQTAISSNINSCDAAVVTRGTTNSEGAAATPVAEVRRERKPSSHDLSSDEEDEEDDDDGTKRYGVPLSRFRSAAAALSAEFGLSLFGFDVIIPADPSAPRCLTCLRSFKKQRGLLTGHGNQHGLTGTAAAPGGLTASGRVEGATDSGEIGSPLKCKYCGIVGRPYIESSDTNDSPASSSSSLNSAMDSRVDEQPGETGHGVNPPNIPAAAAAAAAVGSVRAGTCSGAVSAAEASHDAPARFTNESSNHSVDPSVDPCVDPVYRPLLVIDVNFFPSYKEVGDFPARLRRFLRRKAGLGAYLPPPVPVVLLPSSLSDKEEDAGSRRAAPPQQQKQQPLSTSGAAGED